LKSNCITYTCIYFYQLGFWDLVIIPAFNTNIIIILVFLHFKFFYAYYLETIITFVAY
jgi:hypothetical protein